MLVGITWQQFLTVYNPRVRQRPTITLDGVTFAARYGIFLNITGVGIVANGDLLRFIPCWCPVRDSLKNAIIMGDYNPEWNSFHRLDLVWSASQNQDQRLALQSFKNSGVYPLRADDPVLGWQDAS